MAIDPNRALQRAFRIAQLDAATFEEVEADDSSTVEAGAVLVVSSIIGSVGTFFTDGLGGFLSSVLIFVGGWFLWAWLSAYISERVFNVQTTDVGEMQRVLGYGAAPRAVGLVPWLGPISVIWTLVAFVFGIRQAGEMTLGQATITAVAGMVPTAIAMVAALAIF